MADKYVIVNKTDLTSMADTIRGALGTTDPIAVGDLANELTESIGTAGGSFTTGDFTPSEKTYSIVIEHGLGITPNYIAFFLHDETTAVDPGGIVSYITNKTWCRLTWNFKSTANNSSINTVCSAYYLGSGTSESWHIFCDADKIDINFGSGIAFIAGKTYEWIAW